MWASKEQQGLWKIQNGVRGSMPRTPDPDLNAQLHVLLGEQAGRAGAGAGRGDRSGTLHQRCPDGEQTAEAGAGTEGCGGAFGATHGKRSKPLEAWGGREDGV